MGKNIPPGGISWKAPATEVSFWFDKVCPTCGWEVVSRNGLKVLRCEVCSENLMHIGSEKQVEVTLRVD